MALINKIKAGQTLYDVKKNAGVSSWVSKFSVWPVFVVSVHADYIVAKWNGNLATKMNLNEIKTLRVHEPK